jgi:putative spermidine/putrescine transport system permease protein
MLMTLLTIAVILFLVLPVFVIIPMSFSSAQYLTFPPPGFSLRWYGKFFGDAQWLDSLRLSLTVGVLTTLLSLVLGGMSAVALGKSRFRGKAAAQNFLLLPMVMPTIIVAIAVYGFESKIGLIGTMPGLVVAHTILACPFIIVTLLSALTTLDPNLENAALSLGANPAAAFFRVTLPVIKPALLSGALFAFITSFDEIVVTLFISGVSAVTLPKKMWDGVRTQIDPTISAISSILIVGIVSILVGVNVANLRREGRGVKEHSS